MSKCLSWVEEHLPQRVVDENKNNDLLQFEWLAMDEEDEDEDERGKASKKNFWLETKKQLQNILELLSEVQHIRCHCQRPDCPFLESGTDLDCFSTGSPRTSPTTFRKDVSYGGFEGMLRTRDVVYGSTPEIDVKKKDPTSQSDNGGIFKRGTPVVRRKRNTAPNVFNIDQINMLQARSGRFASIPQ